MNVKSWIPLVVAVLLALIALVVARKVLSKPGAAQASAAMVPVAVAAKDLPPGKEIGPEDLTVTKVAAEMMPGGSFRAGAEVAGRTTILPVSKGQPVVEGLLAPVGTKGGLGGLIKSGYRAMTVEVNEFSGLAGMIQPGARVDVIASLRDDKSQQPAARTILQRIEVRAVGRNINPAPPIEGAPPPPPSNNVTLLLTPRQAQILQLATQSGRPWLVLRNNLDGDETPAELTTLAALKDQADADRFPTPATAPAATKPAFDPFAVAPTSAAAARVVQVIRGGVETLVTMQPGDRMPASAATAASSRPADPFAAPATRPTAKDSEFTGGADAVKQD